MLYQQLGRAREDGQGETVQTAPWGRPTPTRRAQMGILSFLEAQGIVSLIVSSSW